MTSKIHRVNIILKTHTMRTKSSKPFFELKLKVNLKLSEKHARRILYIINLLPSLIYLG